MGEVFVRENLHIYIKIKLVEILFTISFYINNTLIIYQMLLFRDRFENLAVPDSITVAKLVLSRIGALVR